jgi:hypothetical protein
MIITESISYGFSATRRSCINRVFPEGKSVTLLDVDIIRRLRDLRFHRLIHHRPIRRRQSLEFRKDRH